MLLPKNTCAQVYHQRQCYAFARDMTRPLARLLAHPVMNQFKIRPMFNLDQTPKKKNLTSNAQTFLKTSQAVPKEQQLCMHSGQSPLSKHRRKKGPNVQ